MKIKRDIAIAILATTGYTTHAANNILVIVADDLGKEVLSIYDTPTSKRANTPNIDKLAQRGITYENVWGYPLSAPVRAAMLTGRYGHNTSIVSLGVTLPTSEQTLFEALPKSYSNAAIGKWHLSTNESFAPDYGIDYFAGLASGGGVRNYNFWRLTIDGKRTQSDEYVTTKFTHLAKEWIEQQNAPWFCWVAYNAPHTPLHLPPSHMHSHGELSNDPNAISDNSLPYYLAMVESLDYEIGRLLESIDDSTTVIFIGDNGTDNGLLQPPYPFRHGKGSLYESGVAIPMVIAGAPITQPGSRSNALVSSVDIFPSILELAGAKKSNKIDGCSFVSTLSGAEGKRAFNFSEILHPRMGYIYAVSDGRYKLICNKSGEREFYDLQNDELEMHDLLGGKLSAEAKERLKAIEAEIKRLKIPLSSIPDKPVAQNNMGQRGMMNRGQNNNNQSNFNRTRR